MVLIRSIPESWILNLRIYFHEILCNMCLFWFFLTAQDWEKKALMVKVFFYLYNKFIFSVIRKYLYRFRIQDSGFDLMNILSASLIDCARFLSKSTIFLLVQKKVLDGDPLHILTS